MKTTITKIGNSAGVLIPVEILAGAGLKVGDSVTVEARDDRNVIERLKPKY